MSSSTFESEQSTSDQVTADEITNEAVESLKQLLGNAAQGRAIHAISLQVTVETAEESVVAEITLEDDFMDKTVETSIEVTGAEEASIGLIQ